MSVDIAEKVAKFELNTQEISAVYKNMENLSLSLEKMGLYHTQLIMKDVIHDYERAIFKYICQTNKTEN